MDELKWFKSAIGIVLLFSSFFLLQGCIKETSTTETAPAQTTPNNTDSNAFFYSYEAFNPPIFVSFQTLNYALDAFGDWYLITKTGNMAVGGEENYRFFRLGISIPDTNIRDHFVKNVLDSNSWGINISRSGNLIVLKNVEDVEQHSQHYEILSILQKDINQLTGNYVEIYFEASSLRTLEPTEDMNYLFSFRGKLNQDGIEVEHADSGGIQTKNIIPTIQEIAKIRSQIKAIYAKEDHEYISGENGHLVDNPDQNRFTTYELHNQELTKRTARFGSKQKPYREWKIGDNNTSITTDAYSDEIAAVLSFVKLVGVNDEQLQDRPQKKEEYHPKTRSWLTELTNFDIYETGILHTTELTGTGAMDGNFMKGITIHGKNKDLGDANVTISINSFYYADSNEAKTSFDEDAEYEAKQYSDICITVPSSVGDTSFQYLCQGDQNKNTLEVLDKSIIYYITIRPRIPDGETKIQRLYEILHDREQPPTDIFQMILGMLR